MPLPALTQRANASRSLKFITNSLSVLTLENDAISSGSSYLRYDNHQRRLHRLCRCFTPTATNTEHNRFFSTSSTSSASQFSRLDKISDVQNSGQSSKCYAKGLIPSPRSPLSRSVSFLRPWRQEQYELQENIRLLDDVSFYFFRLLFTPEFCFLTEMISQKGFEIRIVGRLKYNLGKGQDFSRIKAQSWLEGKIDAYPA